MPLAHATARSHHHRPIGFHQRINRVRSVPTPSGIQQTQKKGRQFPVCRSYQAEGRSFHESE
ncbi:hypothetical protein B2M27_23475 [Kluyvera intermedia]|uniref:Uncharacterized protein n=1 Tax=Kluyvera intermedia TaxID=61648 RepID=A0ABX3U8U8_KLUIN|nr:hypothetical protein B2M27_23475 [Kluyvera intermedia]